MTSNYRIDPPARPFTGLADARPVPLRPASCGALRRPVTCTHDNDVPGRPLRSPWIAVRGAVLVSLPGVQLAIAVALLLLAVALPADAQQATKLPRIGVLAIARDSALENLEAFRQGLRERGWVEGQNMVVEERWAEGRVERLADFAAELVGLKVDVIVRSAWRRRRGEGRQRLTVSDPGILRCETFSARAAPQR